MLCYTPPLSTLTIQHPPFPLQPTLAMAGSHLLHPPSRHHAPRPIPPLHLHPPIPRIRRHNHQPLPLIHARFALPRRGIGIHGLDVLIPRSGGGRLLARPPRRDCRPLFLTARVGRGCRCGRGVGRGGVAWRQGDGACCWRRRGEVVDVGCRYEASLSRGGDADFGPS